MLVTPSVRYVSTFLPPFPDAAFLLRVSQAVATKFRHKGRTPFVTSVSRPFGHVLLLQPFGTTKALTPESRHLALRSPRLSRHIFPTFRLQPRCAPRYRFTRPYQRTGRVPDFAMNEQARRYTPPNRVRYPADHQFASGCSPPHFAVTQLPSATGPWLTLTQTFTVLT
jgi:hypothetical protein